MIPTARPQGDDYSRISRPTLILALLATAQLMLVLDVTVVNVALPAVSSELDLTSTAVPWVMTSYTLLFGGLMLLGGRLADIFGARRMTLTGLAAFTTSSLMCALSIGPVMLLCGRACQGIGAAVMAPAALATALSLFDEHGKAKSLGVWSTLAGMGSVLGVVLGGFLTEVGGWRWIFAVNIPIGLGLLLLLPPLLPASRPPRSASGTVLDLPGAALVTAGTVAAIYGLTNAGSRGWFTASTAYPLVGAAVLWSMFAAVEKRTRQPLLRLDLLARREVLAGCFLMLVATGLLIGGFFLGSFSLQQASEYGALHVGLLFLPVALATGMGAHLAGHLLVQSNAKVVATLGLALATVGYTAATAWSTPAMLVAGTAIAALGVGATIVTAFTAALSGVSPDESGLRSALVSTFHELGGSAGIAVLSTTVSAALAGQRVKPDDFTAGFATAAVAAVVGCLTSVLLVPAIRRSADAPRPTH